MANPQTENGFLQIANEIWNEVIRRDFSKRQKDIILFIWRLSYGCKKKVACIPMLKDFELCGVGPQNITKELNYLVTSRVIEWNKIDNIFIVNKDYERWQISPVKGWDEERFKKLVHHNIGKTTSQNEKLEQKAKPQPIVITSRNKKLQLLKTRSYRFLKQEVRGLNIPCRSKVERVSKERFKDIIKKRFTTTTTYASDDPETVTAAYALVFGGGTLPGIFQKELVPIMVSFGEKYVVELILESGESGSKPSLRHILSIHESWSQRGVRSREEAKAGRASNQLVGKSKLQQGLEELERMQEEERRREQVGSH